MMVSTLAYTEQMRPKGQNPAVQQTAHYQYMRFSVTGVSWRSTDSHHWNQLAHEAYPPHSLEKNDVAAGRSVAP